MPRNVDDIIKTVSPERRKKIEARAAELRAEEMALRDLRQALRRTQETIGEALGIGQDGVSRLEKRSDLLISTLRRYVEAMGGDLQLVAKFPDRPAVLLTGLADVESDVAHPAAMRRPATHRSTRKAKSRRNTAGRRASESMHERRTTR